MKTHIKSGLRHTRSPRLLLAAALLALPVLTHAVTINLSNLDSLATNFTKKNAYYLLLDDSSGTYASFNVTGAGNSSYTGLYTPGGTTATFSTSESLTISFNYRVAGAKSSIGLHFADSTNLNNNVLVLFNVDNNGTKDLFRVFTDGDVSLAGAGTAISAAQQETDTSVNVGTQWATYSATFSVVGTTPTVTLKTGGSTFTYTLNSGTADWTSTAIVLRLSDTATAFGSQGIDIQITPVPEPATTALLAGLACLLAIVSIRRIQNNK
ncbi:PEP-CTERM sorting domain-containing protein [Opitutaceae bacterium TAV4]|nr:PEP-CTERM sorting domain-containing protein [Opitutaceae bacterium TAV4]RRK00038.1 PEP-CTERM sorting domain-containing protein [Opitutaceae bacterium TAV3]